MKQTKEDIQKEIDMLNEDHEIWLKTRSWVKQKKRKTKKGKTKNGKNS